MCLFHLLVSRDIVQTAILTEVRTCLLEVERHVGCDALLTDATRRARAASTAMCFGAMRSSRRTPTS